MNHGPTALRFWFHDAATAVWIDGTDAVFVSSRALRTPMGGGLVAYRDLAAADARLPRASRQRRRRRSSESVCDTTGEGRS